MQIKEVLRDWVPPIAIRLGRSLLRKRSGKQFEQKAFSNLVLPKDHALLSIRQRWPLYDEPLTWIADAVRKVHGDFRAIDIGANVGDSAALINAGGMTPVLCIEGDPSYFEFLDLNSRALGSQIAVEKCFVGSHASQIDPRNLNRCSGTTNIRQEPGVVIPAGLPLRRLESIVEGHPEFRTAQLIKIDTDGSDFDIIISHLDFLAKRTPVVYFEYLVTPAEPASSEQALACIRGLLQLGYVRFLIFDNFGHYMLSATSDETFKELNWFLLSNAAFGTAIHYLDVCAIAAADVRVGDLVMDEVARLVTSPKLAFRVP